MYFKLLLLHGCYKIIPIKLGRFKHQPLANFKTMKFIILSIAIFAVSCSNNKEENKHLGNNIIETSHDRLSDVVHSLLETEVRGYVVISKSALEYSSIQMAREDKTEPKAIVKFDVNRFDHHTPKNIGGIDFIIGVLL